MDDAILSKVLEKALLILSTSTDLEERTNAQDTIDKLVELIGKEEVSKRILSLDSEK